MLNMRMSDVYIIKYVGMVPVLGFVPNKTTLGEFLANKWLNN